MLNRKTHKRHILSIFFITLADSLSNCPFFNCLQKWLKCLPTNMGSALRHFLHLLTAASIMFCSRPIQTSTIASWIHQYSWMLGLSNLVIDWLLVATFPERWNFIKFFVDFNADFVCSVLPSSAEADVGWGGKLNGHSMACCVMNMWTKNYIKIAQPFFKLWKKFGVFLMPHSE